MKMWLVGLFVFVGIAAGWGGKVWLRKHCAPKYAVILQAGTDTHEGLARALHALLYSKELKEQGYEVVLIFDGAGTAWAEAMSHPDHKLASMYRSLSDLGVTEIVCDFCSTAFQVKKALQEKGTNLVSEYSGHPSIVKWVKQGYQLVVL